VNKGGVAGFSARQSRYNCASRANRRAAGQLMNISRSVSPSHASQWSGTKPPLLRFLEQCHAEFAGETSGSVANYIPELGKAEPDRFGISLATTDGHVYEVGDTRIPFTIQSMSKPFVFA